MLGWGGWNQLFLDVGLQTGIDDQSSVFTDPRLSTLQSRFSILDGRWRVPSGVCAIFGGDSQFSRPSLATAARFKLMRRGVDFQL